MKRLFARLKPAMLHGSCEKLFKIGFGILLVKSNYGLSGILFVERREKKVFTVHLHVPEWFENGNDMDAQMPKDINWVKISSFQRRDYY